jgi:hypothetical protein
MSDQLSENSLVLEPFLIESTTFKTIKNLR